MNVNVIGSNTEIYSGVGFLTQAAPTNFHVFMKRKVLAKDEAADDWREETEAEKKLWNPATRNGWLRLNRLSMNG